MPSRRNPLQHTAVLQLAFNACHAVHAGNLHPISTLITPRRMLCLAHLPSLLQQLETILAAGTSLVRMQQQGLTLVGCF
jgi:hypothetical protein